MVLGKSIKLLSCNSGKKFAEKILVYLNKYLESEGYPKIKITESEELRFANTEIKSNILESIRGSDLFIVQDVSNSENGYSVDENLRALKTLISASKISDSRRITAILPTFPYARQDKPWGREGITAKLVAKEIELAGAGNLITLDLHNPAIVGFFDKIKVLDLKASKNLCEYIKKNINLENLVVSAPDIGALKRAHIFANILKTEIITIYKERNYKKVNFVDNMELIGNVSGKDVLLIDDMLDTGGTIYNAVKLLNKKGANKIYVAASLCFFNGKAVDRLNELYDKGILELVIGTNSVYHSEQFKKENRWYKEVDIADYFAKVIFNLHTSKSISNLLK